VAFAVGARCINPATTGGVPNVYKATVGGISSNAGSGPTGTTTTPITDGTVTWLYLGAYSGSVVDIAPELAGEVGASTLLTLAESMCADADLWGDIFDDGRRYLAAHFGQLSRLRGKGMITSEGVGPLSRSYAQLMGPNMWQLTAAGRVYETLARTTGALFGSVP
jgi:hypothetical protein